SHWSTSKTPSYTKSVSWHHYRQLIIHIYEIMQCYYIVIVNLRGYSRGQTFLKCVQKALLHIG
ncbi:hypothetical protein PPECC9_20360, partial [Escherichia coli PCN009]